MRATALLLIILQPGVDNCTQFGPVCRLLLRFPAQVFYACLLLLDFFIAEYYNPTPVEVKYRGHDGRLFKRDFAGEMLDRFPDLKLVDYGFNYHRDHNFPQDDGNWFLLEKRP